MTGARDQMLGSIRAALGRGPLDPSAQAACDERLTMHRRNLVPARGRLDMAALVDGFTANAIEQAATVERLAGPEGIPAAVADFLARHNLPAAIRVAPDPALAGVSWSDRPTVTVSQGSARDSDTTGVTAAFAGVAETGTLVLTSGPAQPTTLNFLPENHVVVLWSEQIVGAYEDAWDRLRAHGVAIGTAAAGMPRTVNFITGPSRTGDIEQKIQLGAHGPRRLHILLVESDPDGALG